MIREAMPIVESRTRQIEAIETYPLLQALIERRSHRFAKGLRLNGGPLAYDSDAAPEPLSLEEEAALAFAACGITGSAMGEMPYETGSLSEAGSGNVLTHFIGRTVASADSMHTATLFVINDEGTWLIKRPQDYARHEIPGLIEDARRHRLVELYEKSRVRISERRLGVPPETQVAMPFNKWAANQPGTTYFLPVHELSAMCINTLLMIFSEDMSMFLIDERNGFRPPGIARFGRSRGGHLFDDPNKNPGRYVVHLGYIEGIVSELPLVEQGEMIQNLSLMTQALGLGGFAHFAAHPFMWPRALGFRMESLPFTRAMGAGPWMQKMARLLRKEQELPFAVGLEKDGEVLIKPFCPPYYPTMEEAVRAFVDYKYGQGRGTYRDGGKVTAWREGDAIQAGVPRFSEQAIEATIRCCEYVYRRYGRFPMLNGPFRTLLAYQAHHLDAAFYDRFYHPDALTGLQRRRSGQRS